MALEVATVQEVAVVGEEMATVVLREEAVVMVPAHPQTQTQTHSLSHPSDDLSLNRVGSGSQVCVSGAAIVGLLALTCNIGALITIII